MMSHVTSHYFFIANSIEFLGNTVCYHKSTQKIVSLASISLVTAWRIWFNGCRVQQSELEYHHPDQLLAHYRCELQYHLLWSEVVVYRTRERSPQVGSSAHSREENHSPDHPRVDHLSRALHSIQ